MRDYWQVPVIKKHIKFLQKETIVGKAIFGVYIAILILVTIQWTGHYNRSPEVSAYGMKASEEVLNLVKGANNE